MKIIAISCFALGTVLLFLAITQVTTRDWGALDVSLLDFYFVALPSYGLMMAGSLIAAGFVATFAPRP